MIRRFVVASTTLQLVASGKSPPGSDPTLRGTPTPFAVHPGSAPPPPPAGRAVHPGSAPPRQRAVQRPDVHDRSAESRSIPRTRIELRPSTTALGFEAAGGANRVQRTRSTQVTAAHPGTTRTNRRTTARQHATVASPHTHTSALRSPLPPTPGRGLGMEVAQRMPRSSTHPDHAASPPLSLCRLEMAPQYSVQFLHGSL